jgi:hypothetical protein
VVVALITFRNVNTVCILASWMSFNNLFPAPHKAACSASVTSEKAKDLKIEGLSWAQAKKYTYSSDAYDVNAVLAALFLGVVVVILFFVVSLVLLLKCGTPHPCCAGFPLSVTVHQADS